jgi:hypothetical protein
MKAKLSSAFFGFLTFPVLLATAIGTAHAAPALTNNPNLWLPKFDGSHCYVAPAVTSSAAPVTEGQLCDEIKRHQGEVDAYVVITQAGAAPLDPRSPARIPLGELLTTWKTEGYKFDHKQVLVLAIQSRRKDHPNFYAFDAVTGDELAKLGITQGYLDQQGIFRAALTANRVDVSARVANLVEMIADATEQAETQRDAGANAVRDGLVIILSEAGVAYFIFMRLARKRIYEVDRRFTDKLNRYIELTAASKFDQVEAEKLNSVQPYWEALRELSERATSLETGNRLYGSMAGWLLLKKGAAVQGQKLSIEQLTRTVEDQLTK